MYHDPELATFDVEIAFPDGLVELWCTALEQPERSLRRRAAATIATAAQRGVPGLQATVAPLLKLFGNDEEERLVRRTAARALIAIDARQAASAFLEEVGSEDLDMAELIEPALARWSFELAADKWLARLEGERGFHRLTVLAIEGLTALEDADALPEFRELAIDPRRRADIRMAAAEGLGQLQQEGLLDMARQLSSDPSPSALMNRLVAANMLASHRGKAVEKLLLELAVDPVPSVQTVALTRLLALDPGLILPHADRLLESTDVNVRRLTAVGLAELARAPQPERIPQLSPLLDDPHPDLRGSVREWLTTMAERSELRGVIIGQVRNVLTGAGWRGQEQAIQLLVTLDDKTIVDRLLELLESQRPEVHATAAWALCQLNVPETVERIFAVFERKTSSWAAGEPCVSGTAVQLSHLAQALGRMKYTAADKVLRQYIPKNGPFDAITRAAAVWALGHLHGDQVDGQLAGQLRARMMDVNSDVPEEPIVRRMAAIALGRMKADSTLPSLRVTLERDSVQLATGLSAAWAIKQLTGEPIPEMPDSVFRDTNWFLVPVGEPARLY